MTVNRPTSPRLTPSVPDSALAFRDCISARSSVACSALSIALCVSPPRGINKHSAIRFWNLSSLQPFTLLHDIAAGDEMNGLIYLVGLVVVIMFILSFLGLR
jgi:hypothetical protein